MTFGAYEESVAAGQPVQLFLFRYGAGELERYAYTDHDEELTVSGITYAPVPIDRDSIESDGTLDRAALKIRTDVGTEVAELFRVYPPSSVVTLAIAQGHVGDPDELFVVTWAGRIVAANRDHSQLTMTGEPISTSLRRPGLRRHYQLACMHQLYGPQCRADKASKTTTGTALLIAGATVLLLNDDWNGPFDRAKFLGGMLEWETATGSINRRTILRVTGLSGRTLELSGVPTDLETGMAVSIVLGCNHKAYAEDGGDCQPLHDNILNYGGCRWIPSKNPIGTFNNYY